MNTFTPTQSFWNDPATVRDLNDNPVTPFSHHGCKGWRTKALETRVVIPAPQLNELRGSLTWWFLPREDFATSVNSPWMAKCEPHLENYTLLGDQVDNEARKRSATASFRAHLFPRLVSATPGQMASRRHL